LTKLLPINQLTTKRELSLDAFRGITFLVMIFVNFIAGVNGIPDGIKHMPAGYDGMSLADIVFPCFLFIVGMSIPFGINSRINKGDSFFKVQWHIAYRAFGLIVMGFYMVNTEDGFNEKAMGMSIDIWALLFYGAVLLVWGVYRFKNPLLNLTLRTVGVVTIVVLGLIYRSGPDGSGWMVPEWWGILGCIGWAYLLTCVLYQLARGRVALLVLAIAGCVAYFILSDRFGWNEVISMHVTHSSMVLAGLVCALLFFDEGRNSDRSEGVSRRFKDAAFFAAVLALAGWGSHHAYIISKIGATPPWALYCSAIAVLIFMLLYWLINLCHTDQWVAAVEPAASNPLITYLIPHVVDCLIRYFSLAWPLLLVNGLGGFVFAIFYSCAVIWIVSRMNRFNMRLKI